MERHDISVPRLFASLFLGLGFAVGSLAAPASAGDSKSTLATLEAEAAQLTPAAARAASGEVGASLAARHERAINLVRIAQRRRAESRHEDAQLAARRAHDLLQGLEPEAAADPVRLADLRELRAYLLTDFLDDSAAAADLLRAVTAARPERESARDALRRVAPEPQGEPTEKSASIPEQEMTR